jgi:hypothetical protein
MMAVFIGVLVSLSLSFLVVFGDRWSALGPFALAVGLLILLLWWGLGLHPLGFLVSPGGWLFLGGVSFIAALVVRLLLVFWDRRTAP